MSGALTLFQVKLMESEADRLYKQLDTDDKKYANTNVRTCTIHFIVEMTTNVRIRKYYCTFSIGIAMDIGTMVKLKFLVFTFSFHSI